MRHDVSLEDRYDLSKSQVLLNGTQALVRLVLMQKARDLRAGLNTAGLVTGYRGSPLGAVDLQMMRAQAALDAADIRFQPGLNEDLAATALWGAQQAELRGDGRFDGVFGLWYGKGPGVDRSGDALRHANLAGTSPSGGVLMALGDDHTGESSTTCHQSDWALVDANVPVLSPAGVQEILDFGLYGFALSRFSGMWAGLKLMKDTVEVTSVVDGRIDRMSFVQPEVDLPPGGLSIRLADHWIAQEQRLITEKRPAAEAFANANRIDHRIHGRAGAKVGLVAAGKNWLDLVHAMALMGIDGAAAQRLGITTYKVGQVFPLDTRGLLEWAAGLDLIVVVEEKRKLIEAQIKEALFDGRGGTRVWGARQGGPGAEVLFQSHGALDPVTVAEKLGGVLLAVGRGSDDMLGRLARLAEAHQGRPPADLATRVPYFCAGCPHNSSTKVPEGSRAYAGIGCHFLSQYMDRETQGFTQMGGEGANWVGEAPFSTTGHVFQNIGDGTYNHSGVQAIRFALAAGVNVTYKILYNDAVAMTGGQKNDGGLTPEQIARELLAMGVRHVALVNDEKEEIDTSRFPDKVKAYGRDRLEEVQKKFRNFKGVTAILYVQTCATEKRRRRKRGTMPDVDRRVFIDTDVCEGCGDCGVQSNCVALVPVDTDLGRKRAVDQSLCNKDFSCLKGFCPSFLTVEGGTPRAAATTDLDIGTLPEPLPPRIVGTWNVVATGIGGTGVVTVGAVLAMAAHLDEKGVGMMEMAGLAQKGGAVVVHCRLANSPDNISAIRVATGEADVLIGGDLVVSAGHNVLDLLRPGHTGAVVNSHEVMTGDFARDRDFRLPGQEMGDVLKARLKDRLRLFDASLVAREVLGDTIYSNMMLLGAAWQRGLVPLSGDAMRRAIELNGTQVANNLRAFEVGRWTVVDPEAAARVGGTNVTRLPETLEDILQVREAHLKDYQGNDLARRYRVFVDGIADPSVKESVARSYHKLLAYKDEYEVARLLSSARGKAEAAFEGDLRLTYHLAPPVLGGKDIDARPKKRAFGPWMGRVLPVLARMKRLRGTRFDPFGYTAERKMERALIRQYEEDMAEALPKLSVAPEAVKALAALPMQIKGFGPVKQEAVTRAARRREELLAAVRMAPEVPQVAE